MTDRILNITTLTCQIKAVQCLLGLVVPYTPCWILQTMFFTFCTQYFYQREALGQVKVFRCCSSCCWQDVWFKNGTFGFWVHGCFIICLLKSPRNIFENFSINSININKFSSISINSITRSLF